MRHELWSLITCVTVAHDQSIVVVSNTSLRVNEHQLVPMPPYDRPRRIPGPMNLVLVPLQPNQPPACRAHAQKRRYAAKYHTQNSVRQSTARNHHTQPARGEHDQENRQREMEWPGVVLEMSAEDWEEAEDFDTEECQAEDMCC